MPGVSGVFGSLWVRSCLEDVPNFRPLGPSFRCQSPKALKRKSFGFRVQGVTQDLHQARVAYRGEHDACSQAPPGGRGVSGLGFRVALLSAAWS